MNTSELPTVVDHDGRHRGDHDGRALLFGAGLFVLVASAGYATFAAVDHGTPAVTLGLLALVVAFWVPALRLHRPAVRAATWAARRMAPLVTGRVDVLHGRLELLATAAARRLSRRGRQ